MLPYSVGQLGQVISYIEHSISDPIFLLGPRSLHMNSLSLAEVQMKRTKLEVLMARPCR